MLLVLLLLSVLPAVAQEYPTVGQIRTRDHVIVVHSAPERLLFTIKSHVGQIIEYQRSEMWLSNHYPNVYEMVVRGIAHPPKSAAIVGSKNGEPTEE